MAIGPKDEIFVLYSSFAPCSAPFDSCAIDLSLVRYSRDGKRDPSFGQGPGSQLVVHQDPFQHSFDLAVGPDGKPVVTAADNGPLVVARFDRAGHLDPTFGGGGVVAWSAQATVHSSPAVAVQSDGKVVVAREAGPGLSGGSDLLVARYLPNGEPDPGFGSGGVAMVTMGTRSRPAGVLLGPDGSISVAAPQCCGGQPLFGEGFSFARLLADGRSDPGWDGDGQLLFQTPGSEATVEAVALTGNGGAVVIFEVETANRATVGNVVKFRPDGTLDSAFGGAGSIRLSNRIGMTDPSGLVVDQEGRLVGVGWDGSVSVFRLRANGGADRTFNGGAHVSVAIGGDQEGPIAVGLQSDGRIVALGESTCCGPKLFALLRLRGGTDRTRCLGHRATIVGTRKSDELTGTRRRDVIAALGGRDEVRGLGGGDLICGGPGRDKLFGGAGRDRVRQ